MPAERNTRGHIFDGVNVTSDSAVFQLCDIEDPLLSRLARDPNVLSDNVTVSIA